MAQYINFGKSSILHNWKYSLEMIESTSNTEKPMRSLLCWLGPRKAMQQSRLVKLAVKFRTTATASQSTKVGWNLYLGLKSSSFPLNGDNMETILLVEFILSGKYFPVSRWQTGL